MTLFDNCTSATKRGDLGEARAAYELMKLGYTISRPLCDSAKYDLLADTGERILKVQCKTSVFKKPSGNYEINLKVSGGNQSRTTIQNRQDGDYDYLFALTGDDECYFIPRSDLPRTCVALDATKEEFRIV